MDPPAYPRIPVRQSDSLVLRARNSRDETVKAVAFLLDRQALHCALSCVPSLFSLFGLTCMMASHQVKHVIGSAADGRIDHAKTEPLSSHHPSRPNHHSSRSKKHTAAAHNLRVARSLAQPSPMRDPYGYALIEARPLLWCREKMSSKRRDVFQSMGGIIVLFIFA